MTKFVCLDTNIYIRFISQGMPDCEREHWLDLVSHVEDGSVELVLPEVIALELKKQWLLIPDDIKAKSLVARRNLEKGLRADFGGTEVREFPDGILSAFDQLASKKAAAMDQRHQEVQQLLNGSRPKGVPFTIDIWHRAKMRSLAGGLANPEKSSEADCILIESLLNFYSECDVDSRQLLLFTENVSDFGLKLESGATILHPRVASDLPPNQLFLNLASLSAFLQEQKSVEVPKQEEVTRAEIEDESRDVESRADVFAFLDYANREAELHSQLVREAQRNRELIEAGAQLRRMSEGIPTKGSLLEELKKQESLRDDASTYWALREEAERQRIMREEAVRLREIVDESSKQRQIMEEVQRLRKMHEESHLFRR